METLDSVTKYNVFFLNQAFLQLKFHALFSAYVVKKLS